MRFSLVSAMVAALTWCSCTDGSPLERRQIRVVRKIDLGDISAGNLDLGDISTRTGVSEGEMKKLLAGALAGKSGSDGDTGDNQGDSGGVAKKKIPRVTNPGNGNPAAGNGTIDGTKKKTTNPPPTGTGNTEGSGARKPKAPESTTPAPKPENADDNGATGGSQGNSFNQDCLNQHNKVRTNLGLPPMTLSQQVIDSAQKWAESMASSNNMQHSKGSYGENLQYTSDSKAIGSCTSAMNGWMSEKPNYNGQPIGSGNFGSYGHYTQIIWPESTSLGCGQAKASGGNVYVACQYQPAGNQVGKALTKY